MESLTTKKSDGNSGWIQTYTGKRFYPLSPTVESVCIEDIAHALANKCRFSGHVSEFYSVAQHSVLVSYYCNKEDALWGLLHDASEAYLVDLPRPLKILPEFEWFCSVEHRVQAVICQAFGLSEEQPGSTHIADKRLLMTEKRDLMKPTEWNTMFNVSPLEEKIVPVWPKEAERMFLRRYNELTRQTNNSTVLNSETLTASNW